MKVLAICQSLCYQYRGRMIEKDGQNEFTDRKSKTEYGKDEEDAETEEGGERGEEEEENICIYSRMVKS